VLADQGEHRVARVANGDTAGDRAPDHERPPAGMGDEHGRPGGGGDGPGGLGVRQDDEPGNAGARMEHDRPPFQAS
jgi:hypothetical protein